MKKCDANFNTLPLAFFSLEGLITPRIRKSSLLSTTTTNTTSLASDQNYFVPGATISDTITSTATTTAGIHLLPSQQSSSAVSSTTVEHLDIKNILSQPMITGSGSATTTTATIHQPTSPQPAKSVVLIEKVVNPQGTVTTVTRSPNENEYDPNDPYAWLETDYVIHENFDEALFRPVVTIFCDNKQNINEDKKKITEFEFVPPEPIKTDLVIPVIEEGHHSEVECEKPPEPIGTELHVPVITEEKLKVKRKNEKIEGNSRLGGASENTNSSGRKKTVKEENIEEQQATIVELPAPINKKTKNNKKGNSSITKEKSPSPKVEVESKESTNQLSYENENYRGGSIKGNIACASITENPNKEQRANDENPGKSNENIFEDNSNITTKSSAVIGGTKSKKSEIKEIKIPEKSNATKSNGKQRKTSKVEFITEDIVSSTTSTKPIEDPSNKSKSEKLPKAKVSLQLENESKKMARVSSDTGIIKSRKLLGDALMIDKELASSCVELVGKNSGNRQKDEVRFEGLKKSEIQKFERDNDNDDGLQFYDKFASESPKFLGAGGGGGGESKSRKMTSATPSSSTDHIQINVEFPSLSETFTDNKKTKKQKGSSPNNSSIQISSNTTTTTTTLKESKKTSGNFGCDSTKLSDDDTAAEIVTITLPNRKKQKKNVGDDNNGKKCNKSGKCSPPQSIDKVDSTTTNECSSNSNEEKSNKKGKNCGSSSNNNSKIKDTIKLPIENDSNPIEFSDDTFLPPLSSLEPFDSNFDSFHFKDSVTGDDDSLINLDSPPQDLLSINSKNNKILSNTKLLVESTDSVDVVKPLHSGYENLIFALCGSLHYETATPEGDGRGRGGGGGGVGVEEDIDNNMILSGNIKTKTAINTTNAVTIKKYSKESQRKRFSENDDEQYLSLEPQYAETTSSSSDADIDESTSCVRKKSRQKLIDDDEELRPLISGANSACSMTSSTSGKKEDDTPSIALEIAKAIVDTLPDNSSNQSDSSDQANISESEIPDTRRKQGSNDDDDDDDDEDGNGTSSIVRSNVVSGSSGNNGEQQQQQQQQHKISSTSAQLDLIAGGGGGGGSGSGSSGNGNGGSGSGNLHQNGKKKLKKKKR